MLLPPMLAGSVAAASATGLGSATELLLAAIGAILVGVSLGLLGSGGAILTVPILAFLVGHDEKSAVVESLVIVGSVALVGAVRAWRAKRVDIASALLLAVPGLAGAAAGAHVSQFVSGSVQLIALAILMLAAAALMVRRRPAATDAAPIATPSRAASIASGGATGLGLGFSTGFAGVGGGFLIVPTLVLLRRLPMTIATGTSLAVIVANTAAGWLKYASQAASHATSAGEPAPYTIDWPTVALFSTLGILGSVGGARLAGRLPETILRRVFALFVVVMAIAIILERTLHAPG